MKTKKNKPMINKSIKFDEDKLAKAKKKRLLGKLPERCREQLDIILNDAEQRN